MNDYELIYLIQFEKCPIALNFLYAKYYRFIWKQIHLLHIQELEQEDFFQEGILMLYKAVKTFNESKNKTFMRYFELILKRHFYYLIKKLPKYVLKDESAFTQGVYYVDERIDCFLMMCSDVEKDVYQSYFIEHSAITKIAIELGKSKKQIYNTIYRIKEKYKNML